MYAAIDATSAGDNTIVAGVSGKTIRVFSYLLAASATLQWKSGSTALSGEMPVTGQLVAPAAPLGAGRRAAYFETAEGEDLILSGIAGGHLEFEYRLL